MARLKNGPPVRSRCLNRHLECKKKALNKSPVCNDGVVQLDRQNLGLAMDPRIKVSEKRKRNCKK